MNYVPSQCPLCNAKFELVKTPETFTLRCYCGEKSAYCTYEVTFYLASFEIHRFTIALNNMKFYWVNNKLYIYNVNYERIMSIEDVPTPTEEDLINPLNFCEKYKYLVVFS